MPWISGERWRWLEDEIAVIHMRLDKLTRMEKMEMTIVDDMRQRVIAQTTVIDSVEALITSINQKLKDALAAGDPKAIQEVSDLLDANTNRLAQDVALNTPSAGEATPTPTPSV